MFNFAPAQEKQPDILQLLTQAVGSQLQKATGNPQGPMMHGPGGIFGVRGLERGIISTHTNITGSLGELIPIVGSRDTNPLFPFITGFVRSDQQEKDGVCDTPEEAGQMKTCIQTTVFGRKEFKTREVEVDMIGQRLNRGEFMDLELMNSPLVNQMAGLMQGFYGNLNDGQALLGGREMMARILEVAVAFQRWLCPNVYTGNPANSSNGGGYKEFMGLDLLIGTSKVDAETGQACPALYSDIKDFTYRVVSDETDPNIHRTLSTMMYILEMRAKQNNLSPVDFRLVMRSQLFFELTRVWPLQYNTEYVDANKALGLDNVYLEGVRMRDDMRNNQYLIINSKRYPVILDDCIPEENNADNGTIPVGGFASDIYVVPFSARGGTLRTLYWEYYDFRNAVVPDVNMVRASGFFWSDSGTFLWGLQPPVVWCLDLIAKIKPRLILRTPQIAGRLTNVAYSPLQHINDPLPSQDYWVNGGVSTGRPGPSPFSDYNLSGPGWGA